MAPAAARFYGDPTAQLETVAITGTNGKTTTAFLLRSLLGADGRRSGLMGTVKSVVGGVEHDVIHFAVAIFTNLTQDHLDFHPTMEDYFQAKRRLFTQLRPGVAVINVDDSYGRRLADEIEGAVTFGLESPDAAYRAVDLQTGLSGSTFSVATPDGPLPVRSPLTGRLNVLNVLGALAAARSLGISAPVCTTAIEGAGQVPGRFQSVDEGQPFAVLVDYAHTPDSLENVLAAARSLSSGRLHLVFGAGGDRDRRKRPQMGAIARRLADRVIVTSDNPRSEDPEAIIAEILRAPRVRRWAEGPIDDVGVAREVLRGLSATTPTKPGGAR